MEIFNKIILKTKKKIENIHQNANLKIKKSNWYHNIFPHLIEYERLEQGADVLVIGSTPAKNAIDFLPYNHIKGYNLAVLPETIFYDFQVLKNYHSYLKKGGTILFVLCPFTFLKDFYRNEYGSTSYLNIRYYPILHRALIDNFDYSLYHKYVEEPLLLGLSSWKRLIKDTPQINPINHSNNPDTQEISTALCIERLKNWQREFHMPDLNPNHIPEETEYAIKKNLRIYAEMKSFVEERGYKATIIVPPFPEEMLSLIPIDLIKHTLLDPIKQTGIPYINYLGNEDYLSRELYYHGFLLNNVGRERLTKDIVSKLKI